MSNIEAGELHSKLSRPNYNLLLDSLNLLFKTTQAFSTTNLCYFSRKL